MREAPRPALLLEGRHQCRSELAPAARRAVSLLVSNVARTLLPAGRLWPV